MQHIFAMLAAGASLHAAWERRHLWTTPHTHNEAAALLLSIHLIVEGVVGHLAALGAAALISNNAQRTLGWPRRHVPYVTATLAAAFGWTSMHGHTEWVGQTILPALAAAIFAHAVIAVETPECRPLAALYAVPPALGIASSALHLTGSPDASRWLTIATIASFLIVGRCAWWLIWTGPLTKSLRTAAGSSG